ncbi:hypothetical protein BBJ28_00000708 [Nothophytophthora sp. Chile5]|nr:hypothetical protein BBJ28_00000708 [Nothophytophthora sp. Chile5]
MFGHLKTQSSNLRVEVRRADLSDQIRVMSDDDVAAAAAAPERTWKAPGMERRDFDSWQEFGEYMTEYQQRTKQVNATLQLGGDGKYHIHVTKLHVVHNHPLDEPATGTDSEATTTAATESVTTTTEATATSATNSVGTSLATPTPSRPPPARAPAPRAAPRPEPQGTAKRRRVGRPPRASATPPPAVTTASQVPTMTDVRQFLERVERVRSQQRGLVQSVEERLASYVNEFAAQDGNVAKIFVDDQKVLSSITLQTKHMRQVFAAFPEVLRVDATSGTSASGSSYRIFSLQAHDTFGNWQYVQHAIVENDRSETLRAALTQFKTHNESHSRVRALLVADGDSPELPELCACFPTARVLYSQFHVVRALHEAIAGLDIRGPELTSWHRDRLTGIVHLLVYAPTSVVYGANVAIMMDVLGSKKHPFFQLFLAKFDAWRDRWSTFAREGVATFSVSERGDQFADTWRAIFAAANDDLALDDTVAAVRYYQAVVERAFTRDLHRAVNGLAQPAADNEFDAEMRLLAATVSPAACQLVLPQYHYAVSRARYQFCEPARGSFFISALAPNDAFSDEPSKEFCVEAERGWQCSCAFMVNHHLPCRHVFYIRRVVRCSSVIPVELLEPRWVLTKAQRYFDAARGSGEPARGLLHEAGLEQEDEPEQYLTTAPPPGAWQKYMAALDVGKRIGQRMMEMPSAEFERAIRFYQLVEKTMNVRPFDLNSPAMARINSGGHLTRERPAARANCADLELTRPPTRPRGATAGTVYVSANDHAAALRNVQLARAAAPVWPTTPSTGPAEVIDLQDESEEEEEQQQETAERGLDGEEEHGNKGEGEGEGEIEEAEREKEPEAPEVPEENAKKRKADDDDAYEPEEEEEDEEVEEQRVTRSRSSVDSIQVETWEEEDVEVDVEEDFENDMDEPGESPQKRVLRPRQAALVSDGD